MDQRLVYWIWLAAFIVSLSLMIALIYRLLSISAHACLFGTCRLVPHAAVQSELYPVFALQTFFFGVLSFFLFRHSKQWWMLSLLAAIAVALVSANANHELTMALDRFDLSKGG